MDVQLLGLDVCAETMVGDDMRRGISGGQKKRVTTGKMIVGPSTALLMDEISTGLDSSTTYQIIKCLKHIVHVFQSTMVISLLQPAPETFSLFDDVILICEGQIVYNGPRDSILEFFETMGFKCPERKGIADFLQEVFFSPSKMLSQIFFRLLSSDGIYLIKIRSHQEKIKSSIGLTREKFIALSQLKNSAKLFNLSMWARIYICNSSCLMSGHEDTLLLL